MPHQTAIGGFVRHTPSIEKIIDYWREHVEATAAVGQDGQAYECDEGKPVGDLPRLKAYWIGWGEPFCFGCGWLAPVDRWSQASRWLDRAHLQDFCVAGDDSVKNLVMLCHLCHNAMPEFDDRASALQWVANQKPKSGPWQLWTDARFLGKDQSNVTRNTLLRQRVKCVEAQSLIPEYAEELGELL
jgi:hypothetical protein